MHSQGEGAWLSLRVGIKRVCFGLERELCVFGVKGRVGEERRGRGTKASRRAEARTPTPRPVRPSLFLFRLDPVLAPIAPYLSVTPDPPLTLDSQVRARARAKRDETAAPPKPEITPPPSLRGPRPTQPSPSPPSDA
jgi:hypothetical protein